jgi:hypothetical protein
LTVSRLEVEEIHVRHEDLLLHERLDAMRARETVFER